MLKKEIVLVFEGVAKTFFQSLNDKVDAQIQASRLGTFDQKLLASIKRNQALLQSDPFEGIHIPQRLIPDQYRTSFEARNLWKMDLFGFWRMIYTVKQSDDGRVYCNIIDILPHKEYGRKFGYHKR